MLVNIMTSIVAIIASLSAGFFTYLASTKAAKINGAFNQAIQKIHETENKRHVLFQKRLVLYENLLNHVSNIEKFLSCSNDIHQQYISLFNDLLVYFIQWKMYASHEVDGIIGQLVQNLAEEYNYLRKHQKEKSLIYAEIIQRYTTCLELLATSIKNELSENPKEDILKNVQEYEEIPLFL